MWAFTADLVKYGEVDMCHQNKFTYLIIFCWSLLISYLIWITPYNIEH